MIGVTQGQSKRVCPYCGEPLYRLSDHSTGELHTVCLKCQKCPDCEEGE